MRRYFKSLGSDSNSSNPVSIGSSSNSSVGLGSNSVASISVESNSNFSAPISIGSVPSGSTFSAPVESNFEADTDEYQADPGERKDILEYDVNIRERVRRKYWQKGPYQPKTFNFPWTKIGSQNRRFISTWFKDYSNWLEYSPKKDVVFCLPCYLFKPICGNQGGGDSFIGEGFKNWKKQERFDIHIGDHNSNHNKCMRACGDLMHHRQHIEVCFSNQSEQNRIDYRVRLIASIDCIRFLLRQGMGFRGHDESAESSNQGKFIELLHFLADHNDEVKKVVLGNAPENLKLTSPIIQRDIINAIAVETRNAIIRDVGVDEARDISVKEQMAIVIRFVDEKGYVLEQFLGIIHVHCFAHQLQLALVSVVESHPKISKFFDVCSMVTNIVGASCKRKDMLRDKAFEQVVEALKEGVISSWRGLNQSVSLNRAGATRWGSHYKTLMSLILLFDPTIEVLMVIGNESKIPKQRAQADYILEFVQCFEFIFCLMLMKNILGISSNLSQALQRKDQDIVNAMNLVWITKLLLQQMRDEGWEQLMDEVVEFCTKCNIVVPNMDDAYMIQGRSRRNVEKATNVHFYRVELFCTVIDLQLQELNNRFNEVNTELLLCMACLCPSDSFASYDREKLIQFATFYPNDFSTYDLMDFGHQLDCYIMDMRTDDRFSNLVGIADLSKKLVQFKKNRTYPLVYLLVKLALILPVATATVERVFSAMKHVKTELRNRFGDELMND